ncbi:hypothetical protein ACFPRL_09560 [Pseudoclavibacter helvolus]
MQVRVDEARSDHAALRVERRHVARSGADRLLVDDDPIPDEHIPGLERL